MITNKFLITEGFSGCLKTLRQGKHGDLPLQSIVFTIYLCLLTVGVAPCGYPQNGVLRQTL